MRPATLRAAVICMLASMPAAAGTPLDWPAEAAGEDAQALHCAAVMTAIGLAYVRATEMTGAPRGLPPGTLPAALLEAAGGAARLGEIRARAEDWASHSASLAATQFYPRLSGEGTPYVADEGRALVIAAERCRARYGL